ncbi:UNVERIFIED_CONTAM: hypothetical protein N8J90_00855 [Halobacillus marinus]|uniref:hypothetical protein n=1 Tax=Bacillaceae TaxID=186817 RepID=UPI0002A4E387|nr:MULTISPECIES: hypothetical protein [Bacillaceae]ELK44206.1 hypothetical protein D479_20053 [Halobacillus sp. BAB-2008]QHT46314.1 hypothetical protein M662_07335 [Bacillus sp. SB49]
MKKLIFTFLLLLLALTPLLLGAKNVSAMCYGGWSIGEPSPMGDTTRDSNIVTDEHSSIKGGATIECGGGSPRGWGSVRSGSTYSHTTSKGTKIYNRSGGSSRANSDFWNTVSPGASYKKYVKYDGSTTFVKFPKEGNVRYYKSHSGQEPSLWFGKEKIRYK